MCFFTQKGRTLLIEAAVVVGAVCLSNGQTRPAALVGQWESEYGALELFKDGRGVIRYSYDGVSKNISWKTEGEVFILTYEEGYEESGRYNLSGYEFSLEFCEEDCNTRTWVKKGKLEEYKKKQAEKEKRREEEAKKKAVEAKRAAEQKFANISSYFTDPRDGQKYRAIKIGGKTWMAQNLNYRTERRSCCYNNDNSYCEVYGRLYDWKTAKTACPSGWHLPTWDEWGTLRESVDYYHGDGKDKHGFSALPNGKRISDGTFSGIGWCWYWWTATDKGEYGNGNGEWAYTVTNCEEEGGESYVGDVNGGQSVRCIKD